MTTPNLLRFYDHVLTGEGVEQPSLSSFEIVVANPSTMGSKGGIVIDQLQCPGLRGKLTAEYLVDARVWHLQTSNIKRFHFAPTATIQWSHAKISIHGTNVHLLEDNDLSGQWLIRLDDGSWKVCRILCWKNFSR